LRRYGQYQKALYFAERLNSAGESGRSTLLTNLIEERNGGKQTMGADSLSCVRAAAGKPILIVQHYWIG
jgi:hypothetical protein